MEPKDIAKNIRIAEETNTPIAPIRDYLSDNDIDTAYAIQNINTQLKINLGRKPVGKKIGLTSESVQKQLGVDQPDFGVLFDDMKVENNGVLSWGETMQPKVEAEISFVLKKDLLQNEPTIEEVEESIDYAVASLEIVGSRIKDWNIKIVDTIADNASASHFVLGENKMKLSEIDIINCKMKMYVNNTLSSEGIGKACLGSPLISVQWLAKQMVKFGNPLKAGDVILSGALGPMASVKPGDVVTATIEGLGNVQVEFSK